MIRTQLLALSFALTADSKKWAVERVLNDAMLFLRTGEADLTHQE
jgi:hypothetical protein